VRVAIDQPRQNQGAARIDRSRLVRLGFEIASLADGDDTVAFNRDATVLDHAMLRIHRDDRTTADE